MDWSEARRLAREAKAYCARQQSEQVWLSETVSHVYKRPGVHSHQSMVPRCLQGISHCMTLLSCMA